MNRRVLTLGVVAALLAAASAAPALAHDPEEDGPGRLERLEQEARRALGLFSARTEELLKELGRGAEELSRYGKPRMLPNGDIIIRRKTPLTPKEAAPDKSEIEL